MGQALAYRRVAGHDRRLTVSTMGNIGHAASAGLTTRATAAVPPLAAAAALAVGLGVLKRVARRAAPEDAGAAGFGAPALPAVPAPDALPAPVPTGADVALSGVAPDDATVFGQPDMPDATRQRRRTQADIEAEALAALLRQPRISGAELGRSVGVSGRTGQRLLTRLTNGRQPASTDDT